MPACFTAVIHSSRLLRSLNSRFMRQLAAGKRKFRPREPNGDCLEMVTALGSFKIWNCAPKGFSLPRLRRVYVSFLPILCSLTVFAAAQSPNTATIDVIDQSGAAINEASISVVNTGTSGVRDAMSGNDGSATIPALSLTGKYRVVVSKPGFSTEEVNDITLRSGETATLRVK